MNIIAVDDERLSLKLIENAIKTARPVDKLKCFNSPVKAVEFIKKNPVDVAFLAIDMFEMDGFSLTKKLREYNSKINIIFVTNYEQYAIESYKLHVSGFLLKPITRQKVEYEIDNLWYKVE